MSLGKQQVVEILSTAGAMLGDPDQGQVQAVAFLREQTVGLGGYWPLRNDQSLIVNNTETVIKPSLATIIDIESQAVKAGKTPRSKTQNTWSPSIPFGSSKSSKVRRVAHPPALPAPLAEVIATCASLVPRAMVH